MMKQLNNTIRQILNGTCAIDNKIKYMSICFGIALVHLVFTIAFGKIQVWVLSIYNMLATLFYIFHAVVSTRKKQFFYTFVSAMTEILLHSGIASIMLGWDWGFMAYTIAIVPVAFYLFYTLPNYGEGIASPVVSSAIVMFWYYLIMIICEKTTPIYQEEYFSNLPNIFYAFNTLVTFIMLLVFSTLFAIEIRYMKRRLEQENQALEEIAKFDPLTHLLNRRSMDAYMHQVMRKAMETQEVFCLIMADIDNFKKFNDTYGHDCGDKVLISVADTISSCVRDVDYVCRWGGEEILMLVQADLEYAYKIAERICREVEEREIFYNGTIVHVTVTMGVADYQEGISIRSIIEKADQNLYKGKTNGKNQVVK